MAVDLVRRPYTTWMRMFDDPTAPQVQVAWYPTDKPFIDFPTAFGSADWYERPWELTRLGEVYGAARNYNGRKKLNGLEKSVPCGRREWFLDGIPWPAVFPDPERDPDGIAKCCKRRGDAGALLPIGTGGQPITQPIVPPGRSIQTATPVVPGDVFQGVVQWQPETERVAWGRLIGAESGGLASFFSSSGLPETLVSVFLVFWPGFGAPELVPIDTASDPNNFTGELRAGVPAYLLVQHTGPDRPAWLFDWSFSVTPV